MGLLREAGIQAFIVSGNHDAASQISRALHLPDNVKLFSHKNAETIFLDDFDVAIHGQSFPSRIVTEDLTQNYPQGEYGLFNIGLLHTALTGRAGHEPYAPCTLDALRSKGYQYWALGHVHQREEVTREPWGIFSGNIQGRHIRESGAKGCTMVTVDEGQVREIEHHNIDVLRWAVCSVDLNECETQEDCLDRVRQSLEEELARAEGRPIAVRLILEGITSLHGDLHERSLYWMEEFKGIATSLIETWIEKTVIRTRKKASPEKVSVGGSSITTLIKAVEDLGLESQGLTNFMPEFEQLRSKLPPDLLMDEDPFNLQKEDTETLREDVKELLIGKMLRRGGVS
jgi:DNA repair exonuclease SbcCD nuclease subunit